MNVTTSNQALMGDIDADPVDAYGRNFNQAAAAFLNQIPAHCRPGIARYVLCGILPGSFLRSVLANEFELALRRADAENRAAIDKYRDLLMHGMPRDCWGSSDKIAAWKAAGGWLGKQA